MFLAHAETICGSLCKVEDEIFNAVDYRSHNLKVGEKMAQENMTIDELKQITIDYYVNLQRIKKANTDNNPELEYQLKIYKNKLSSLGIPSEEYEM